MVILTIYVLTLQFKLKLLIAQTYPPIIKIAEVLVGDSFDYNMRKKPPNML